MEEINTQEQTITIEIPTDSIMQSSPHTDVVQPGMLSTSSPQDEQTPSKEQESANAAPPKPIYKIINGVAVLQEVKDKGGRPCEYCKRPDEINKIAEEYLESARQAKKSRKPFIPYQQELADMLDIDNDTLYQWTIKRIKESDELEHPKFTGLIKKLNTLKELLLLQRTTGRYNPTGAIFQLKTKHGYIETEKQVLAGDHNEPIKVEIVEEKELSHE